MRVLMMPVGILTLSHSVSIHNRPDCRAGAPSGWAPRRRQAKAFRHRGE